MEEFDDMDDEMEEENIDDDDDYLCRFASRAPLTSIHRRSHTHPYDPGR